jgi:putative endonuclease
MAVDFAFFRRGASPTPSKKQTGSEQETRVLLHFQDLGWSLLERNYRCPLGEVDLILKEPSGRVVFVEVKFRTHAGFGGAVEALRPRQRDRIVRAALHFIKSRGLHGSDFRFDIAAASPSGIEHIPHAFSAEGYTL